MATKTYKVIEKRDGNPKVKVIESGKSLKEANAVLMDKFNRIAESDGLGVEFKSWGLAVAWSKRNPRKSTFHNLGTFKDGTRFIAYDVYEWFVEEEGTED